MDIISLYLQGKNSIGNNPKIFTMSSIQISRDNYLNYILQKLTFKFNF